MDNTPSTDQPSSERGADGRILRRHIQAYLFVNGSLFLINLLTAGGWWVFWPIFGWGMALAAHWFYVKSIYIEDEWVEERTLDIRHGAYDLSHIHDIEKRHIKAGGADRPPDRLAERTPKKE